MRVKKIRINMQILGIRRKLGVAKGGAAGIQCILHLQACQEKQHWL